MQEEWKPVVGYEGLYEVSNLGRVKSVHRIVERSDGKTQTVSEKIIKQQIGTSGYYTIRISNMGVMKTYSVHKLICQAFYGHKPNNYKEVVDHIDGNRLNNNLANLQIISHRVNVSKGFKNKSSKYTGVFFCSTRKLFIANIKLNGKREYIGAFKNEEEAYNAYKLKFNEYENQV